MIHVPPRLIVVKQFGCEACAEAQPALDAFARKYAGQIFVIPVYSRRVQDWEPRGTPAYALIVENQIIRKRIGVMTLAELERWVWRIGGEEQPEGKNSPVEDES